MNLFLVNDRFMASGIFGTLFNDDKSLFLQTLQHAYPVTPNPVSLSENYEAKIPPGTYTCVRGTHKLEATKINPNPQPFETFEITGVPGHTNLIFHVGNYNKDSSGCILLGNARHGDMVLNSRDSFEVFMNAQSGCDSFTLIIT